KTKIQKDRNKMNSNQVKAFVDTRVQALADARIKPIVDAIDGELATIRRNEDRKAQVIADADKDTKGCRERITKYQAELVKAKEVVAELQSSLSSATTGAVTQ